MPLPLPNSRHAPKFTGKNVRQYIETITMLGANAGYTNDQLPTLLVRFANSEVRKTLAAETAFTGQDWAVAKARLLFLYESLDKEHAPSASKLRKFAKKTRKGSAIRSRKRLDEYYRKFKAKEGTLVTDLTMTETERNYLFYYGLPKDFSKRLRSQLTAVLARTQRVLKKKSPPTVEETMAVARLQFDPEDIDNDSDSDSSDDDDGSHSGSSSDEDSDSDSDGDRSRRGKSRGDRERRRKARDRSDEFEDSKVLKQEPPAVDAAKLLAEEIRESLSELRLAVQASSQQYVPPPSMHTQSSFPQVNAGTSRPSLFQPAVRFCYMCGKTDGQDLDHRLNIKLCPFTQDLLGKNLIKYCPRTGNLVRADGSDLPRAGAPGTGGIAALLLREEPGRSQMRDLPPHQTVRCDSIGLFRDDRPVVQGRVLEPLTEGAYAFLGTRSQNKSRTTGEKRVHFDDSDKSAPGPSKGPIWKDLLKTPIILPPADDAGKFTRSTEQAKKDSAPHPDNTEGRWRAEQKQKNVDRRATVEDEPEEQTSVERTKGKSPYRFTSNLQEQVSAESVEKQLLGAKITLTLREILGMSPELQRHMQHLVKTRREFANRAGAWDSDCAADDKVTELRVDEPGAALLTFGEDDDLRAIFERYASAVALGSRKYFAMQSGLVQGIFGNEKVTFLIDSGSELNIISRRVWEQTNVPVDADGSRWTLRGIGGEPVALLGCCRDAPVQLGGKNFDHHFFVSTREHGPYDAILGQPWLSWFSCDIQYNRNGSTFLRAHTSGDKNGAFASVEICKASAPRNTDRLVLTGNAHEQDDSDF
ncbi:hypothetical protein PHLGIDRAFT_80798 [Phlebiopsis gigantea 11061_1 CR5-6]|uniref:Peptidase A2 domain-containing protein n=1 Tax=Phlebiopsis gigantea (strain 11061_1 CR5-6) TaxID=745531 RepID=A0A0C3RYI7_PHLG1|nr:hypothetical protein PHLGIDRAFT_80798 [Phlebiopsis gigantea 11061_1 CR5-6]